MCDFETATWKDDETWVWAWAVCEIGNEDNIEYGNNIDDFMEFCKKNKNNYFYFHNLKFDGSFILWWLLKNGFTHAKTRKEIKNKTFTTIISDMGMFYNIVVYYKVGNKNPVKITFFDSLKIIPFSVDAIAKTFGLPISKLTIDYNKPRKKKHRLTEEEKEYIKNDVLIVAKALKILFDEGLNKMTQGSNAISDYKNMIGMRKFRHYFPVIDKNLDEKLRERI